MNTGYERSLTLTIRKYIADIIVEGYPVTYQGREAFTFNSVSYPAITVAQMATIPVGDYEARLADFKAYVEQQEIDLDIDGSSTNPARRENLGACPI